jgi:hypothetical protein
MGSITRPLGNRLDGSVKLSTKWKGIIIAEGLEEPSVVNEFGVYRARISKQDEPLDDQGNNLTFQQTRILGHRSLSV